jgi:hypothetical protein
LTEGLAWKKEAFGQELLDFHAPTMDRGMSYMVKEQKQQQEKREVAEM